MVASELPMAAFGAGGGAATGAGAAGAAAGVGVAAGGNGEVWLAWGEGVAGGAVWGAAA